MNNKFDIVLKKTNLNLVSYLLMAEPPDFNKLPRQLTTL